MNESEFQVRADALLARIEAVLEASDADVDWEYPGSGILQIDCADGSQIIINRHLANREVWVAARAGGFHFRLQGEAWVDTRDGPALFDRLQELLAQQAGVAVQF